jgi:hypothetical protein
MLARKLEAAARRLRAVGGELLALARDLEDAARALRGEP